MGLMQVGTERGKVITRQRERFPKREQKLEALYAILFAKLLKYFLLRIMLLPFYQEMKSVWSN